MVRFVWAYVMFIEINKKCVRNRTNIGQTLDGVLLRLQRSQTMVQIWFFHSLSCLIVNSFSFVYRSSTGAHWLLVQNYHILRLSFWGTFRWALQTISCNLIYAIKSLFSSHFCPWYIFNDFIASLPISFHGSLFLKLHIKKGKSYICWSCWFQRKSFRLGHW